MEHLAVIVNDATQARRLLAPLLIPNAVPTHWLLVADAPRLNHRIARWTTADSRAAWRQHWCDGLRLELQPWLDAAPAGACFSWHQTTGPLVDLTRQLRLRHGAGLRLLDARLARPGLALKPLQAGQAPARRLAAPVAVTSTLSVLLALCD